MGHSAAVGMGHGAQPVPGAVGGVKKGAALGGIPLDEIAEQVRGSLLDVFSGFFEPGFVGVGPWHAGS